MAITSEEREKQRAEVERLIESVCLHAPLYVKIDEPDRQDIGGIALSSTLKIGFVQLDCYCIYCKRDSTFRTSRLSGYHELLSAAEKNGIFKASVFTLQLHCQRDNNHIYSYLFGQLEKNSIVKIGQYPSMEDIAASDIQRFRGVLEPQYFSELHRAGGLISHGIGIGAFVYLRRIFERLIVRHHEDHRAATGSPIDKFETMRMDEKIDALSAILPVTLVENKAAYGILSRGLHELDEETCKKHYPVVRAAIIAILEEDLQTREKARAATELRKAIAVAAGELKTSDGAK